MGLQITDHGNAYMYLIPSELPGIVKLLCNQQVQLTFMNDLFRVMWLKNIHVQYCAKVVHVRYNREYNHSVV